MSSQGLVFFTDSAGRGLLKGPEKSAWGLGWNVVNQDLILTTNMVGRAHPARLIPVTGLPARRLEGRSPFQCWNFWVQGATLNPLKWYGDPIGRLDKSWKNACKAAELDGRVFHDFRNFLWVKKICQQSIKGEL
jgi:hypothetical protein